MKLYLCIELYLLVADHDYEQRDHVTQRQTYYEHHDQLWELIEGGPTQTEDLEIVLSINWVYDAWDPETDEVVEQLGGEDTRDRSKFIATFNKRSDGEIIGHAICPGEYSQSQKHRVDVRE